MRQNNEIEKSSNELKEIMQAMREQKERTLHAHAQNRTKNAYKRA
ncbi:hypothetical protein RGC36_03970 [Helicobacter pylori]|nr:hypothetical protein [Helicobacter pylori]MDU9772683.1 hypothetical protein [Helicobacter pylori]